MPVRLTKFTARLAFASMVKFWAVRKSQSMEHVNVNKGAAMGSLIFTFYRGELFDRQLHRSRRPWPS